MATCCLQMANTPPQHMEAVLEPRKWTSHGSELEVEAEKTFYSRNKFTIVVKRRLKDFGGAIRFSDSDTTDVAKSSVDFAPYEDKAFNIRMKQHHKGCQRLVQLETLACQTEKPETKNIWTQYHPREMNEEQRNIILQSDAMTAFLSKIGPRLFHAMEQSELIDVFGDH